MTVLPPARRDPAGVALVLVSTVAWSTAGFFMRLIALDGWTILAWRGVFGALAALAFVAAVEGRNTAAAFVAIGGRGLLFCLLSTGGMVTFLMALTLTSVAHVAILNATIPLFTAGLARLVLKEPLTRATLVASLVALGGAALAVGTGIAHGDWRGDGLAALMALCLAGMVVVGRGATVPIVPATCLSSLLGSAVSLPFAGTLAVSPGDLLSLALFGVTTLGLGLILFTLGAARIPAAQTALIGALDAPLAPLWVWLAFGEVPGTAALAGGAIVVAAVVGNILADARPAQAR